MSFANTAATWEWVTNSLEAGKDTSLSCLEQNEHCIPALLPEVSLSVSSEAHGRRVSSSMIEQRTESSAFANTSLVERD